MREYIIHSPLHPQAVRRVRRMRAAVYARARARARVCVCVCVRTCDPVVWTG